MQGSYVYIISTYLTSLQSSIFQSKKLRFRDLNALTPSPTSDELGFASSSYESEIHVLSFMVT